MTPDSDALRRAILNAAGERGPQKSICPSEVARDLGGATWRALMPAVREAAADLVDEGCVRVTRGGCDVDARNPGGPVRIAIVPGDDRAENA